jgi:3-oxoacyl-[acyl-carrier protein] reductase
MVGFEGVHDRETVIKGIPAHRLGQPEDIGRAARFLCSRDSDYVTGQVLHINGGLVMG